MNIAELEIGYLYINAEALAAISLADLGRLTAEMVNGDNEGTRQ
jgi:hypothetical protein